MSLGWFEKKSVEKTVKKVIDRIVRNVDQTIGKNPGLTMEEALKIVDRKQGVFFPGETSDAKDLKSLFALIVWKGYRNIRISDPKSSSREHREFVRQMVCDYLNDQNSASQPRYRKILKPVAVAVAIGVVIILIGLLHPFSFSSKSPATFKPAVREKNNPASSSSSLGSIFKYRGHVSDDDQKLALVNKSVYREGDVLGERGEYMLKSISPRRIVIRNNDDQSEISVSMQ